MTGGTKDEAGSTFRVTDVSTRDSSTRSEIYCKESGAYRTAGKFGGKKFSESVWPFRLSLRAFGKGSVAIKCKY